MIIDSKDKYEEAKAALLKRLPLMEVDQLETEILQLVGVKGVAYKWMYHDDGKVFDICANPYGIAYKDSPFERVKILRNLFRVITLEKYRKQLSARKAAATRAKRRELEIDQLALSIAAGERHGPRSDCKLCGRYMDDGESVARGIGPECWQQVLRRLTAIKEAEATGIKPQSVFEKIAAENAEGARLLQQRLQREREVGEAAREKLRQMLEQQA